MVNFKEFSIYTQPHAKTLRICGMTWETYCREEARECEKLARVAEGEARKDWAEAARQWRMQLRRVAQPEGSRSQR